MQVTNLLSVVRPHGENSREMRKVSSPRTPTERLPQAFVCVCFVCLSVFCAFVLSLSRVGASYVGRPIFVCVPSSASLRRVYDALINILLDCTRDMRSIATGSLTWTGSPSPLTRTGTGGRGHFSKHMRPIIGKGAEVLALSVAPRYLHGLKRAVGAERWAWPGWSKAGKWSA